MDGKWVCISLRGGIVGMVVSWIVKGVVVIGCSFRYGFRLMNFGGLSDSLSSGHSSRYR